MDEFDVIEALKRVWDDNPKGKVHDVWTAQGASPRLLFELRGLQVFVMLMLGPRNGVSEFVHVLDPSQPVLLDQLVIFGEFSEGNGALVARQHLRWEIRSGKNPEQACRQSLQDVLDNVRDYPEIVYAKLMTLRDEPGGSIHTISGGLPTLGKRR